MKVGFKRRLRSSLVELEFFVTLKRLCADNDGVVSFEYIVVATCIIIVVLAVYNGYRCYQHFRSAEHGDRPNRGRFCKRAVSGGRRSRQLDFVVWGWHRSALLGCLDVLAQAGSGALTSALSPRLSCLRPGSWMTTWSCSGRLLRSCASVQTKPLPINVFTDAIVGLTHIPGPLVIFPLFAARLLWRLGGGTSE
jgi:hypothetical protein